MSEDSSQEYVVLMAVTGMSPAILTETIWALARRETPIVPDRVVVLTTIQGAERLRRELFEPTSALQGQTAWGALLEDLRKLGVNLEGRLRFGATSDDIRILTAPGTHGDLSRELDDIRSPDDNNAASDFILDQIRTFTENPDTRLITSIAGGRKTMGALLYACMSLAGREHDMVTHVLVSEPFETISGFFFPGQPGILQSRLGNQVDSSLADVQLAEVPFVPLRNLFLRELGRPVGHFSSLVERCRRNIRTQAGESVRLRVDMRRCQCEINGQILRLAPREHLIFLFLAQRAKAKATPFTYYSASLDYIDQFRQELIECASDNDIADWRHEERLLQPLDERDVSRIVSDIRRKVQHLGGDAALLAACLPEKGRFSLDVPPALIEFRL